MPSASEIVLKLFPVDKAILWPFLCYLKKKNDDEKARKCQF